MPYRYIALHVQHHKDTETKVVKIECAVYLARAQLYSYCSELYTLIIG